MLVPHITVISTRDDPGEDGQNCWKENLLPEILQQMAYSKDTDEYMELYNDFQRNAPSIVFDYFNEQWHSIRDQWTLGAKCAAGNFFNNTSNRIESINAKLKSVISKYSESLEEFVDNLFLIMNIFRRERDHKAAYCSQKVPTSSYIAAADPNLSHYMKHLTPYAFRFVQKQFELKKMCCHYFTSRRFSVF